MKLVIAVVGVCLFVCSWSVARAQQQQQMPTPSPQHQKMGYFAGNWKAEGIMKVSPTGSGGPFSLTETGEWVTDGFFLETHTSMKSPMGHINSVRVMGYNPEDRLYTFNVYNSLGETRWQPAELRATPGLGWPRRK